MASTANNSLPPVSTVLLEKYCENKPHFFIDGTAEADASQSQDAPAESIHSPDTKDLSLNENTSEISSN